MEKNTEAKLEEVKKALASMGSAVIAYSGGVDSSLLLKIAADAVGRKNILAATAESPTYTEEESIFAKKLAKELRVRHESLETDELSRPDFSSNPPARCYFCKLELFSELEKIRKREGFKFILDGSNADDTLDYRPGAAAAREMGVRSPLKEAGLTKSEIRSISKKMNLPTWDKPALACLASRIPYGEAIDLDKLERIRKAESFIRKNGIKNVRVRHHGNVARIEAEEEDIPVLLDADFRRRTAEYFKEIGFKYVTVDIEGYRTGSMNEAIETGERL